MPESRQRGGMWWKRVIGSPWVLAFAALFGAPGVLDDFAFWQREVGDMSAGWQGALLGVGVVLICLWLLIRIERHWVFIRTNPKELAILALAPLILALIGYGIYYLVFVHEPTETVWVHPILSVAEQERAKAECRMAAYDAIGGGRGGLKDPTPAARSNYVNDCLTSKGFASHEVKQ